MAKKVAEEVVFVSRDDEIAEALDLEWDAKAEAAQAAAATDELREASAAFAAPAPAVDEWFAGVPQDVPDNDEARAIEHAWQLEHNPSYQGQFAPKNVDKYRP